MVALTESQCRKVSRISSAAGVFFTKALDVDPRHYWSKMREIEEAVEAHERVSIRAGHGVSKTYTMARLALKFLYLHAPATVVTTAPTGHQVKDLLWRELRAAHSGARIPLGGKLTTMGLDLQELTGQLWFATGFSTKPDTVTQEATAFQGYHNQNMLLIYDEGAGVLPEIWRAGEHIGAPYKRWVVIGNATSRTGDFAATFSDPSWHNIQIAVKDTPNYKLGRTLIPGIYGREYEQRIREKYGADSDEYAVRVMGEISNKAALGAYYGATIRGLRDSGMLESPEIRFDPTSAVYTVWDPGYTTGIWWFQKAPMGPRCLWYYEDSGPGVEDYTAVVRQRGLECKYNYGGHFVPSDADNNAQRATFGKTVLEIGRDVGLNFRPLEREKRVMEGIDRARRLLLRSSFTLDCHIGVEKLEAYHERVNKRMSSDEHTVFTGSPERDGTEHCADAWRYLSLAYERLEKSSVSQNSAEMDHWRQLYGGYYA